MTNHKNMNILNFRPLSPAIIILLLFAGATGQYIASPSFQIVGNFIQEALFYGNIGRIIFASLTLISLNTLTELPIFLGAFALCQRVSYYHGYIRGYAVLLLAIGSSYFLNYHLMNYSLDLSTPVIITFCLMLLLQNKNTLFIHFRYHSIIIIQVVLAFQLLEVSPYLQNFGFGKSEYVDVIFHAVALLGAAGTLELFIIFIFSAILLSAISSSILLHTNILRVREMHRINEKEDELQQMRMHAVEARVVQEMHSLVHDLKTPLTTIQGLMSLIQMIEKDPKKKEYTDRVLKSVEQLNEMISEILYESIKQPVKIGDLINYTRAHLILEGSNNSITFDISDPDLEIKVNKIRMTRVLTNLIQNAIEATGNNNERKIKIASYSLSNESLPPAGGAVLCVNDNGVGMDETERVKATNLNFSSKGKSGLGLAFVKRVISDYDGILEIESEENSGTTVKIILPKEEVNHDTKASNY